MASATQLNTTCQYCIFAAHIDLLSIFPYGRTKGITNISTESQAYELSPTTSYLHYWEISQQWHRKPIKVWRSCTIALLLLGGFCILPSQCTLKISQFHKNTQNSMWSKNLGHQTRKWFPLPGMKRQVECSALKKKIRTTAYQRLNMLLFF